MRARRLRKNRCFFDRQLARWKKQWMLSKQHDNANMEQLIAWLSAHLPARDRTCVSHVDFRIGNQRHLP
jgi:aminoglycoside phosphotransferase (APT) family kinase protein